MDYPKLIVSNQKEESISIQELQNCLTICWSKLIQKSSAYI